MYDTLDEARTHAQRATGLCHSDISIVQTPHGFALHAGAPPDDADVVEVVPVTPVESPSP